MKQCIIALVAAVLLVAGFVGVNDPASAQNPVRDECYRFYDYAEHLQLGFLLQRCTGSVWTLGGDGTGTGQWFSAGAPDDLVPRAKPCYELHFFEPYDFIFLLDRCDGNTWMSTNEGWRRFKW